MRSRRMKLKLQLPLGADGAPVEIDVSDIESFHPIELYKQPRTSLGARLAASAH
jgi:hypothetical protein